MFFTAMHYTQDHEWIDFRDSRIYAGVSKFKLSGFHALHEVKFSPTDGFKQQGEVLAFLKYDDYQIHVHMPVDGRINQINNIFQIEDLSLIYFYLKCDGWIFAIDPSDRKNRKGLVTRKEYLLLNKSLLPVKYK
jgi:glycine cleavage system H protein